MAQGMNNVKKLQKGLEYRFLYKDDSASMHYYWPLENQIKSKRLRPKYISMKSIRRSLVAL